MTAERTIQIFHENFVQTSQGLWKELRKKHEDYAPDYAVGVFEKWLTDDDARQRFNLVYGRKLAELIMQMVRHLHEEPINLTELERLFRLLSFVVGPKRLELSAAAVTACACVSD